MPTRNKHGIWKTLFYATGIIAALFFDVALGDARYPIITLIACGIVILYERVSPYLYIAR